MSDTPSAAPLDLDALAKVYSLHRYDCETLLSTFEDVYPCTCGGQATLLALIAAARLRAARPDEEGAREASAVQPRPEHDWHEDDGAVLWWRFPVQEPPHCGTPHDSDWPFFEDESDRLWWTPIHGNEVHEAIERLVAPTPSLSAREREGANG
jgi:hypothetical protein